MADVKTVLARDRRTGHEAYINPAECDDCWEVLSEDAERPAPSGVGKEPGSAPSGEDEQERQADSDDSEDAAGEDHGDAAPTISEMNVGQAAALIAEVEDPLALASIEEHERDNKNRKGVLDAIAERRGELEG